MTVKYVVGECVVIFKLVLLIDNMGYFQCFIIRENTIMSMKMGFYMCGFGSFACLLVTN